MYNQTLIQSGRQVRLLRPKPLRIIGGGIVAATLLVPVGTPATATTPAETAPPSESSALHRMGDWASSGITSRITSDGQSTSWAEQIITGRCGVDVSYWDHQGSGTLDFNLLRQSCPEFVFVKVSEFVSGKEGYQKYTYYETDKAAAKAAGFITGAYQYAKPTSDKNNVVADATAQAQGAVALTGPIAAGELPPVLDLESAPSTLNKSLLTLWAITWLTTVQQLTGRTPIIYSYTSFMSSRLNPDPNLVKYPLWQAEYDYRKSTPTPVSGWPVENLVFWQFSSKGQVPGIGGTYIDMDVMLGTDDNYRALTLLNQLVPPAPAPTRNSSIAIQSLMRLADTIKKMAVTRYRKYNRIGNLTRKQLRLRGATKKDLRYGSQWRLGVKRSPQVWLRESYTTGSVCALARGYGRATKWFLASCPSDAEWRSF